jgi:nucleoid-associated protein YejK
MKKVLSVRVENSLYTRVNKDDMPNSILVSKALTQFFRAKEPNTKLFSEKSDYVDFLKQSIDEKNQYISFLQKEVESLTVMSMAKVPLLARIKMKLLRESSETAEKTKNI